MSRFDTSYLIIQPSYKGDYNSDWLNCQDQLIAFVKCGSHSIFRINIFVHASEIESFQEKKRFITDALLNIFGEKCPAFGVLPQFPEKPFNVSIEVGIVKAADFGITYRKYKDYRYTILENDTYKELWANGLEDSNPNLDLEAYSISAFEIVQQILLAENMTFNNLVRQWNYIGNILHTDRQGDSFLQHYQIFNEVRHSYYSRYRSIQGFPAATGIGMKFNGVAIDICAIKPCDDISIVSVNNPKQINPYSYEQEVLIGSPIKGHEQKTPPEFERAKLIVNRNQSKLFISGTASIIGQETIGKGDVVNQTQVTIENMQSLVNRDNLLRIYPHLQGNTPGNYKHLRVYVKRQADIPIVKSICDSVFINIPVNYVQADICRDDLLVEIEAELSST